MAIPSTGGWQTWETVVVPHVSLKAGVQTMRLAVGTGWFNLNYVDFVAREVENTPVAAIVFPENNSRFPVGEPVRIVADAEKSADGISRVEYFAGAEKLGESRGQPYEIWASELPAGVHSLTARVTNREGISAVSKPVRIEIGQDSTPFSGEPARLPGRIWAKEYDLGGEGVAYHDVTPENEGNVFRPDEGVDLEPTADSEGDFNLGWTAPGEWIRYTVDVERAGVFEIAVRVASIAQNSRFRLEFPDASPIEIEVPNTGGWQRWTTVSVPGIALKRGVQTMTLVSETGDFNVNYIDVRSLGAAPPENFAGWLDQHFSPEEIADETVSGATADASGNGIPNLLAYALGLDPHSTSREGLPKSGLIEIDGERYLTLTYIRPTGIGDLRYQGEVSSDLKNWSSGDGETVTVSVTSDYDFEIVVIRDAQPLKSLTARQIRLRVDRVNEPLSD